MTTCGIIYPRNRAVGPRDDLGCRLPNHHEGPHEFVADDKRVYRWETDHECNCHDCQSDDANDWCIVIQEIDHKEPS